MGPFLCDRRALSHLTKPTSHPLYISAARLGNGMAEAVPKPDYIFDRVVEWQALAEFATDDRLGATLGMVSRATPSGEDAAARVHV